jgi:hypothetical protein
MVDNSKVPVTSIKNKKVAEKVDKAKEEDVRWEIQCNKSLKPNKKLKSVTLTMKTTSNILNCPRQ